MFYIIRFLTVSILFTVTVLPVSLSFAQDLIPQKTMDKDEMLLSKLPALRLTPDKPQIIELDADVANIIIGNKAHLAVTPDTPRRLILIPRQPGATFLRILGEGGAVVMERHVLVAVPKKKENYVRIRRSCINGDEGCQEYSMYYCPDMCHKLGLVQEDSSTFDSPETSRPSGSQVSLPPLEPADGVQ